MGYVLTNDVMVKVEVRSPQRILQVTINEEFESKVVIALDAYEREDKRSIKVMFEDETYVWIDCPEDSFIYRTYQTIAVDDNKNDR